ncbi:hypothetical protein Leryth_022261, partial [Lithospermum erythrorhizon]
NLIYTIFYLFPLFFSLFKQLSSLLYRFENTKSLQKFKLKFKITINRKLISTINNTESNKSERRSLLRLVLEKYEDPTPA